jgi:GntR family transcriptional regulator, sialic acid-inducible nan operon repressor
MNDKPRNEPQARVSIRGRGSRPGVDLSKDGAGSWLNEGRRKRSQEVVDRLEAMIRDGTFSEGDQLPSEAELSKLLSVGRPAVREALFVLQFRGLVEVSNGARARVTSPSADFLMSQLSSVAMRLADLPSGQKHLEETRLIFESGLAWLAAQNATEEDIDGLRKALEANVAAMGDVAEFIRTDIAFHFELAQMARNPIFEAFHNVLVDWLINQRTNTINMPEADSFSVRDHTAIFNAVAARDPARAYHSMASHLRLVSRLAEESMRLQETLLLKVTRDVAAMTSQENAEIWRASFGKRKQGAGASHASAASSEDGSG